jgi:hypothetical protein
MITEEQKEKLRKRSEIAADELMNILDLSLDASPKLTKPSIRIHVRSIIISYLNISHNEGRVDASIGRVQRAIDAITPEGGS